MTDADRERTAFHESGHALVGMLTPGADPVRKISIIPRGQALGVTLSTPETDRYGYARDELIARIKVALGGRAAEKVVYDEITTGAESDIQNLTQIARGMVGALGHERRDRADRRGRRAAGRLPAARARRPRRPQPWRRSTRRRGGSSRSAEREVIELLERERHRLDALAHALLEHETLDQADAYRIAGIPEPAQEPEPAATGAGLELIMPWPPPSEATCALAVSATYWATALISASVSCPPKAGIPPPPFRTCARPWPRQASAGRGSGRPCPWSRRRRACGNCRSSR